MSECSMLVFGFHIPRPPLQIPAMSMKGWADGISSETFLDLFKVAVAMPPDDTQSYSNKGSSNAELYKSGPSLQRLHPLDVNSLFLGKAEKHMQWARECLGEFSPVRPCLWDDTTWDSLPPQEISSESNVLTFVESRYLQRALCAGLFLCFHAMGKKSTVDRCPGRETAYWHDSSTTGTSGRPDRILKYLTVLFRSTGDEDEDDGVDHGHSIGCVVEGKTARVCAGRTKTRASVNVLQKLGEFAGNWTKNQHGNDNNKWLKAGGTWEVKAKEFLLQVNLCLSNIVI